MLENLLNTKLKQKLLNVFFGFPKRGFSAFELRALTRSANPFLNKTLREFVKAEVIEVIVKGKKRYYRINQHFRLYDELRDLALSPEMEMEDEVCKKLKQIPNLKLIVLSGIFTFQPRHSIDLLMVGEDINRFRLQKIMSEIEKITDEDIKYAVMNAEEYNYRRMMNDRLIRDILDYPHLIVLNTLK